MNLSSIGNSVNLFNRKQDIMTAYEHGQFSSTEIIHRGKANNVWGTTFDPCLILEASDRISAGNGEKTDTVSGKGVANNIISTAIFQSLEERGIPTHFIGSAFEDTSKLVLKTEPILLEVIGRFYATGSFAKRYGVPDMKPFDGVYIEYTYKSDAAGDPPICNDAIVALGLLTRRELGYVEYITEQVALVIQEFFAKCNGRLIDFKIEFGRLPNGQIIVIDEISPDTCRIADNTTGESLDKDRFRKDLGDVASAYSEMLERVQKLNE